MQTVARGPVPRDPSTYAKTAPDPERGALACHTRMREGFPRDLPRTRWHGEGQALALREGKAFFSPKNDYPLTQAAAKNCLFSFGIAT